MRFRDRYDAGHKLAEVLQEFAGHNCVVLALPRGGVPIGAAVAQALHAPMDVLLVRKIGAPRDPELAIGSIIDGTEPIIVRDRKMIELTGTTAREFEILSAQQLAEIERRRKLYLGSRAPVTITGRTAIIVDDGMATGNTMRVALQAIRLRNPETIIAAVPVSSKSALSELRNQADRIVCLESPEPFRAVGEFYDDFSQISDAEVIHILNKIKAERENTVDVT